MRIFSAISFLVGLVLSFFSKPKPEVYISEGADEGAEILSMSFQHQDGTWTHIRSVGDMLPGESKSIDVGVINLMWEGESR